MPRVDLIVTNVNPAQFAACLQFNDQHGQNQLLCLLQRESTTFKISSQEDETSDCTKRKIRFVNEAFFKQIDELHCQEPEALMRKFCSMLVEEISQGRVLFEQQKKNGQVDVIASPTFARALQNGGLMIKNKKGKVKSYEQINCADERFFKHIAQSFADNLQVILAETAQFIQKNQLVPKSSPEGIRNDQERQIVAKESSWSIWNYLAEIKNVILKHFEADAEEKTQGKYLAHERDHLQLNQQRDSEAKKREEKDRKMDQKRYERNREERKRDAIRQENARTEVKREEISRSSHKQEARLSVQ